MMSGTMGHRNNHLSKELWLNLTVIHWYTFVVCFSSGLILFHYRILMLCFACLFQVAELQSS